MAIKRVILPLFRRQRYAGGATASVFYPQDRERVMKDLGGASKVTIHARVYDRSSVGTPSIDFTYRQGSFGDEAPGNSLRIFSATMSADSPTLPWNPTNMTSVPDDGTFTLVSTMGLLDLSMKVSGSGTCWVEAEVWATAEYAG